MLARPLPWFRAGGGYLVPLFAAQSRHEEPYPPMSKINIPFKMPFTRNVEKYTPFPRRFQAGNAVSGNCAGRLARRARPTRCGAQSDCPLIRPRQARPLPLYASAVSSVRGTSIIRKRVAAVPFVTPKPVGDIWNVHHACRTELRLVAGIGPANHEGCFCRTLRAFSNHHSMTHAD